MRLSAAARAGGLFAAATGLGALANGTRAVAVLAWVVPLLWLRLVRAQPLGRGMLLLSLGGSLSAAWALRGMVPLPPLTYALVAVVIGCRAVFPYLLQRALGSNLPAALQPLLFPAALTALSYTNSLLQPYGSWGEQAYTQANNLPLLQTVSVTGLPGITFLVALPAAVLDWAWARRFAGALVHGFVVGTAVVVAACFAAGSARLAGTPQVPASKIVSVAAVDSPLHAELTERLLPAYAYGSLDAVDRTRLLALSTAVNADLLQRTADAAQAGARIVMWGEAAALVDDSTERALLGAAAALARRERIHLAATLLRILPPAARGPSLENLIVFFDSTGAQVQRYRKATPVPGGEAALLGAGTGELPVVETEHGRIALAICFDADFPRLVRKAARARADLLLVPAEDWPDIAGYHARMAVARALEGGMSLVRASRYGLALAADPYGRVLAQAPFSGPGHEPLFFAQVPVQRVATPYTAAGDAFAWLMLGTTVVLVGLACRRRRGPPRAVSAASDT